MESPGRDAIHPDVTAPVVRMLVELGHYGAVSAEQLEILQQRTLYGSDTTSDFTLAESAGVALLHQSSNFDCLVLFLCVRRVPEGDWQLSGLTTAPLGAPPLAPHVGRALLGPTRAIFGSVVTSPEIGAVRATLPDGSQLEDPVTNRSSLLVVPLRSQAVQRGTLIVQILDRAGGEVTADRHQLPYGTTPTTSA
jgi:hypothetical protein